MIELWIFLVVVVALFCVHVWRVIVWLDQMDECDKDYHDLMKEAEEAFDDPVRKIR